MPNGGADPQAARTGMQEQNRPPKDSRVLTSPLSTGAQRREVAGCRVTHGSDSARFCFGMPSAALLHLSRVFLRLSPLGGHQREPLASAVNHAWSLNLRHKGGTPALAIRSRYYLPHATAIASISIRKSSRTSPGMTASRNAGLFSPSHFERIGRYFGISSARMRYCETLTRCSGHSSLNLRYIRCLPQAKQGGDGGYVPSRS